MATTPGTWNVPTRIHFPLGPPDLCDVLRWQAHSQVTFFCPLYSHITINVLFVLLLLLKVDVRGIHTDNGFVKQTERLLHVFRLYLRTIDNGERVGNCDYIIYM